jgi:hypothetical protein
MSWVNFNSGNGVHGVHEALPGQSIEETQNFFGLIPPIGNVSIRSNDGVIRGGMFYTLDWITESSCSSAGYANMLYGFIGSRLAEEVF